jgi:hypothetical protein
VTLKHFFFLVDNNPMTSPGCYSISPFQKKKRDVQYGKENIILRKG